MIGKGLPIGEAKIGAPNAVGAALLPGPPIRHAASNEGTGADGGTVATGPGPLRIRTHRPAAHPTHPLLLGAGPVLHCLPLEKTGRGIGSKKRKRKQSGAELSRVQ